MGGDWESLCERSPGDKLMYGLKKNGTEVNRLAEVGGYTRRRRRTGTTLLI